MLADSNFIINFIVDRLITFFSKEKEFQLPMSLSKIDLLSIFIIGRYEKISMGKLAESINLPVSTATGMVNRLVKNGLVERVLNEANRRIINVRLSEKGRELIDSQRKLIDRNLDDIKTQLNDEEQEQGRRIFTKLLQGFESKEL